MLLGTTTAILLGYLLYKHLTRGQKDAMSFSRQL